jgi:hypothetical protein
MSDLELLEINYNNFDSQSLISIKYTEHFLEHIQIKGNEAKRER